MKATALRDKTQISQWFRELQLQICDALEKADGQASFQEDAWVRTEGGGGQSRVIQSGAVIEKGGVNYSAVYGPTPDVILQALKLPKADFYATGISIVIHPVNPWCPIIHMNTRYFEMSNGAWWFGGGIDLTPHYVIEADARYFHGEIKKVCDRHHSEFYADHKKWADNYFYIKHREETRGIGGIFFDRMTENPEHGFEQLFAYVQDVGKLFAPVYTELLSRHKNDPYTEVEKKWQKLRRGRYVEFNLVYDKGTKFGLDTHGRIESILMSLPPEADWAYNYQPNPGSKEAHTLDLLKKGLQWA